MEIIYSLSDLRQSISKWKREGRSIGFVPTMGNLHDGHLSLLKRAQEISNCTICSIFVNPIQFGKGEDYEHYPSTLEQDSKKLSEDGLDLLFTPNLEQLYPGGIDIDTRVTVPELSSILCGKFRPDHFPGVATVVTKLLINVQPDYALFGEKDYQQLLIIKRMVEDLCIPVNIVGMPIMREADGLAMSSRNAYLTEEERKLAPLIFEILKSAAVRLQQSPDAISTIEDEGMQKLAAAGFKPEYFSIRRSIDLGQPLSGDRELSILVATWLGSARLIDNIKVVLD